MKKLLYTILFFGMSFLVSCSTVLRSNQQIIVIAADKSIKNVSVNNGILIDSIQLKSAERKKYIVERSRQPLWITLQTDSSMQDYALKPRYTLRAGWAYPPYGLIISAIVSAFSPNSTYWRRYPSESYFHMKDSNIYRTPFAPTRKGQIDFRVSYHLSNEIVTAYKDISVDKTGAFFGIGLGMDYYTKKNQYISIDAGIASTRVPCDLCATPDTTNRVSYLSVRNNHVLWNRLDLGYGLNLSYYSTLFEYRIYKTLFTSTRANTSLGLSFMAEYRVTPHFRVGFLAQPNIYTISPKFTGFASQSYFSINMNFIIPVSR
jgi:hypothetical protein